MIKLDEIQAEDIVRVEIDFIDKIIAIGKCYLDDVYKYVRLSNGNGIYLDGMDTIIRINHPDDIKEYALELLKA